MHLRHWLSISISVAVLLVALMDSGSAGSQTLWRIGIADNSYDEFAIAGNYRLYTSRFSRDVTFIVGKSTPKRDWSFIQPGPIDYWARHRRHPFRIRFNLSRVPGEYCRLVIDFVNTHRSHPPLFEVKINDRAQYQFALPAGGDDRALTNPKFGREYILQVTFPARHLRRGENVITLTIIAGSWVLYDALWLEGDVAVPKDVLITNVQAKSTMLFKRINGQLKQLIEIVVTNTGAEGDAIVRITGARRAEQKVHLIIGSTTAQVFIKPIERPMKLRITVQTAKTQRSTVIEAKPVRRWLVFVTPSTHTDIGYTDLQTRTFKRHNDNTKAAIEACSRESVFKWNLEVAFQARNYRREGEHEFRKLVEHLRTGRIGLQGLYLNMLTGLCSGEELARALYYGKRLGRTYGFRVDSAILTDVPTSVGTLPMLLSQAGIRYFAEGINQDRAPVFWYADPRMRQAPFWWEGLDGSRVLALFSYGYGQAWRIGLVSNYEELYRKLPNWLRGFERPDYPFDAVFAYGGFGDNQPINTNYATVAREWNSKWAYPKIIIATVDEFFRYIERKYGDKLPTFRGDMGVYWEDGAASSAYETALVRWAKARLVTAEKWHALTTLLRSGWTFPISDFESAWEDVLFYDEHTWGAWCSISQPESEQTRKQWEFKAAYAYRSARRAKQLYDAGMQALQSVITSSDRQCISSTRTDNLLHAIVFNEFSWRRNIPVRIKLPEGWHDAPIAVCDALTRRRIAHQRVSDGSVLFIAMNVPPVGYRSFTIQRIQRARTMPLNLEGNSTNKELRCSTDGIDSPYYRIRIDRATGAIVSLYDKVMKREWVDKRSPYAVNQFLYVLGGEGSRIIHPNPNLPMPKLKVATHLQTRISKVEVGNVRAVVKLERRGNGIPAVDTYIAVYRDLKRVDIVNIVHKELTYAKEAAYFAFPFAMKRPRIYIELPYGVLHVEREQLPGACREWYCTNSFVMASNGNATITLATPHAPLLTFDDINRGTWRKELKLERAAIFAYVMNNYWHTNYKAGQSGDIMFAFSITTDSHRGNPVRATQFGWESLTLMPNPSAVNNEAPMRLFEMATSPQFIAPLHPARSFIRISPAHVLLSALFGADDNQGIIVRLFNPAHRTTIAKVHFERLRLRCAWQCSLIGTPLNTIPIVKTSDGSLVKIRIPARGVATIKVTGNCPTASPKAHSGESCPTKKAQ